MLPIAPLDYERYAVVVSLPPPPEAVQSGVAAPTRAAEPIAAANATSSRRDHSSGQFAKIAANPFNELDRTPPSSGPKHVAKGPYPTGGSGLAGPPPVILSLMTGEPDVTPRQVSALYERAEGRPANAVDILA